MNPCGGKLWSIRNFSSCGLNGYHKTYLKLTREPIVFLLSFNVTWYELTYWQNAVSSFRHKTHVHLCKSMSKPVYQGMYGQPNTTTNVRSVRNADKLPISEAMHSTQNSIVYKYITVLVGMIWLISWNPLPLYSIFNLLNVWLPI